MAILNDVQIGAVSIKPSKYDEGSFSHGYMIDEVWYNIDCVNDTPLAKKGDVAKVEVQGKELLRIKVTGNRPLPALDNKGKPTGKTYIKGAVRTPYKKSAAEVVSMALSTALKCASDIGIATKLSVSDIKLLAVELASMIVSSHGQEALDLVKKSDSNVKLATVTQITKVPEQLELPLPKQVVQKEDKFDDDIPF